MSCTLVATDDEAVCANCGLVSSDTVKLKSCTACRLVKYCGVDCQRAHRKQHKKECKRRATELKDEQLYSQGHERPEGDFCPICTLPIPLPMGEHSTINVCCMKRICYGCDVAAQKRGMINCAFCRTPYPHPDNHDADSLTMIRARVTKKDPEAIDHLGQKYFFGELGLQKDVQKAVELFTEAADLGSIQALYNLADSYENGEGVDQDKAKAAEVYAKAALQGHVECRFNLGCIELKKGNHDRAVRHWMISAKMGDKGSVEMIKMMFDAGVATKEQHAEALRGYQDTFRMPSLLRWNLGSTDCSIGLCVGLPTLSADERERHCQAEELYGLPPRQVLWRGLPEGPPQAAQEGVQAACGRARGRAAVQPGAREGAETSLPENAGDMLSMIQARVLKKDPEAIYSLGQNYFHGELGLQRDMQMAVELWEEAAELVVRFKHSKILGLRIDLGMEFNRTKQRAPNSTKKRPCKEMLRAGAILAVLSSRRGTTTAQ
ncbi:hypothetical protein THAOC_31286 [Thalassiosira oceanica]|uniref:MYND-type domain-containing protein n=1 Tax=Thalassiosira oceanica TaxID=159749 RepID=K0RLM2_THAOC|nr:hypothetical protein THAOC_31286 [Thalassiosira oceanica]|eukprot:EJK49801.1 hypothetical protein THAOC_31286 [Thalassiosira oceanica]